MKLISERKFIWEEYRKNWKSFNRKGCLSLKIIKTISNKTDIGYAPYSFKEFEKNYNKIRKIIYENKRNIV